MPVGRVPPRGLSVSFEPGGLGRRLRVAADGWHDKRALLRPPVLHGQGQSRLDRATIRARPHPGLADVPRSRTHKVQWSSPGIREVTLI